jgi:thiol:disulfide interchange protein DsbC
MKKRTIVSMLFALVFVFVISGNLLAETVEQTLKREFPRVEFDSIKPTDIKGLYEVTKGPDIIYFVPEPGYLILGDIYNMEVRNVTERRKGELFAENAKNLPLEKAVKVGSGKNTIVEFTDPDCPYCRTASSFLGQRKDVTRHIFFFPLPMHEDAENKIKYIFCADDRAKAYEDAMQGKLDDKKYEKCSKPEATELLELHKQIGQKMRISGTPFFVINGKKAVVGANISEIEEALVN